MRIDGRGSGIGFNSTIVQTLGVLAAVMLVLTIGVVSDGPLNAVRHGVFDTYQKLWPIERTRHDVVVVAVDDESIRRVGQWPWPRDVLARLVTDTGQARAIGLDVLMPEPDRLSPEHLLDGRGPEAAGLRQILGVLPRPDIILAEALQHFPVVLAVSVGGPAGGTASQPVPFAPVRLRGRGAAAGLVRAKDVSWPLPALANAAHGLGVVSTPDPVNGSMTEIIGAVAVSGSVLPGFAVELLRVASRADSVVLRSDMDGESIEIGPLLRAADASGGIRPRFNDDAVPVIPAWRLLTSEPERTALAGKIAIIGVTATGIGEHFATPLRAAEPGALVQAELVEAMLADDILWRPPWARLTEWFAGLVVGIGAGLLLGRISYRLHAALSVVAVLLVFGGSIFAFARRNMLLDPSTPLIALLAAVFVALIVRVVVEVSERRRQEQALSIALVEQRAAERELTLRREADRLRQSLSFAVEAAQFGAWDANLIDHTWHHSPRCDALLGLTAPPASWSREMILEQVIPEDRTKVIAGLDMGEAQERFEIECRIRKPDGNPRHIRLSGRFWTNDANKPTRVAGVVADITQQCELEQRLHDAEKSRTIGKLAAGVAHNFNNLLTVVLGNLDLAKRRVAQDDATGALLAGATTAAERGAGIARQLLTFARLQPLAPQRVDPRERLRDVEGLLRNALPTGIRLTVETESNLDHIRIDPVELEFALINLVLNARDAMPEGGSIDVHARNQSMHDSRLGLDGRYVAIEITDTGTGIDPAALPTVFDPFFTTKEVGKGTGLGLSHVHGFAHQSGGAVDIESQIGRGTRVRLYLPSFQPAASRDAPRQKGGSAWDQPHGNGPAPASAWFLR
ncbi:MAG TPA: CHASE2 domain-containing protein [Acetobacteraceae bacterium]